MLRPHLKPSNQRHLPYSKRKSGHSGGYKTPRPGGSFLPSPINHIGARRSACAGRSICFFNARSECREWEGGQYDEEGVDEEGVEEEGVDEHVDR